MLVEFGAERLIGLFGRIQWLAVVVVMFASLVPTSKRAHADTRHGRDDRLAARSARASVPHATSPDPGGRRMTGVAQPGNSDDPRGGTASGLRAAVEPHFVAALGYSRPLWAEGWGRTTPLPRSLERSGRFRGCERRPRRSGGDSVAGRDTPPGGRRRAPGTARARPTCSRAAVSRSGGLGDMCTSIWRN